MLLGPEGLKSTNHVGFVFSERLINMPVQVVPHMYRMLADEIQWALDDVRLRISFCDDPQSTDTQKCQNEPYDFKYLILVSRIYRLTAEEAAELHASAPRTKRQKQSEPPQGAGVYPFHPEDDIIRKVRPALSSGLARTRSRMLTVYLHSLRRTPSTTPSRTRSREKQTRSVS